MPFIPGYSAQNRYAGLRRPDEGSGFADMLGLGLEGAGMAAGIIGAPFTGGTSIPAGIQAGQMAGGIARRAGGALESQEQPGQEQALMQALAMLRQGGAQGAQPSQAAGGVRTAPPLHQLRQPRPEDSPFSPLNPFQANRYRLSPSIGGF